MGKGFSFTNTSKVLVRIYSNLYNEQVGWGKIRYKYRSSRVRLEGPYEIALIRRQVKFLCELKENKSINTNPGLVLYVSCGLDEKQDAEIFCMTEMNLQLMIIHLRSAVTRGRLE